MAAPYYVQTLASQRVTGTLFNTYTSAKTVLNPTEIVAIPPNYLQLGSKLRIRAWGGLSNIVTTPGTVTFQTMIGPVGTLIVAWTSGTIQLSTTANTLTPFTMETVLRVDAAGSGTNAKLMGGGYLTGLNPQIGSGAANPTVTDSIVAVPAGSPADGTGFDSTVTNILDFWVGFSISNVGNGVQLYDYTVEQLN